MNEWQIFLVIVAIVSFTIMIGTPIVKLTSSITKLIGSVEGLRNDLNKQEMDNKESHKELWEHNDKQDTILNQHENRIIVLEQRKEK